MSTEQISQVKKGDWLMTGLSAASSWERPMLTSAEWLARCTRGAVNAGWDFESLLAQSFIPLKETGPVNISVSQQILLTLNIVSTLDDEAHGLCRSRVPRGSTAVLLSCLREGENLDAAMRRMTKFFSLSSGSFQFAVTPSPRFVDIAISAASREESQAALIEERWAAFLYQTLCWFADRQLPLLKFQLRQLDHPALGRPHPLVGGPVTYGSVTLLRIPSTCLAYPRRAAYTENPVLAVQEYWATKSTRRTAPLGRTAHKAAVVEAAVARLRGSTVSIEQVASELGYAEARSLRRLVKAKTGLTPIEIRSQEPDDSADGERRLHALATAKARSILGTAQF